MRPQHSEWTIGTPSRGVTSANPTQWQTCEPKSEARGTRPSGAARTGSLQAQSTQFDATGETLVDGTLNITSVDVGNDETRLVLRIDLTGDPVDTGWGKEMIGSAIEALDNPAPAISGWGDSCDALESGVQQSLVPEHTTLVLGGLGLADRLTLRGRRPGDDYASREPLHPAGSAISHTP